MTLVTVTLGGDQLETHLHFLSSSNRYSRTSSYFLTFWSSDLTEFFFLAFFSFLDDSIWQIDLQVMVCSRRDFSCLILKIESLLGLLFQLGTHFLELLQLFAKRKKMERKFTQAEKT